MSYRQAIRIRQAVKEKGIKGLIHGNTGRKSSHRIEERIRKQIVDLSRKRYAEFNDSHFTEQLEEREGIGYQPGNRPEDTAGSRDFVQAQA